MSEILVGRHRIWRHVQADEQQAGNSGRGGPEAVRVDAGAVESD